MKTYTQEEITDKYIGKRGTPRREQYENNLKMNIILHQLNSLTKKELELWLKENTNYDDLKEYYKQYLTKKDTYFFNQLNYNSDIESIDKNEFKHKNILNSFHHLVKNIDKVEDKDITFNLPNVIVFYMIKFYETGTTLDAEFFLRIKE